MYVPTAHEGCVQLLDSDLSPIQSDPVVHCRDLDINPTPQETLHRAHDPQSPQTFTEISKYKLRFYENVCAFLIPSS